MKGTPKCFANWVQAPGRRQNDLGTSFCNKFLEPRQRLWIDDVGKVARIRRAVAVQDTVDIQEDNLHASSRYFALSTRWTLSSRSARTPMAASLAVASERHSALMVSSSSSDRRSRPIKEL